MNHFATPRFWRCYHALPSRMQTIADKSFALLKENPNHPSLRLKPIGDIYFVRVSRGYRALATRDGNDMLWFWIGTHAEYDQLIN